MATDPASLITQQVAPIAAAGLNKGADLAQNVTKQLPIVGPGVKNLVAPIAHSYADTLQHGSQILAGNNPYKGTPGQIAGQAGTDVLNAASVIPVGTAVKGAQIGLKGGPALGKQVLKSAAQNAAFGAGYGATGTLAQKGTPEDAILNTVEGGLVGGALGAGVPLAGAGARQAVKGIKAVDKVAGSPLSNERGATKLPGGATPEEVANFEKRLGPNLNNPVAVGEIAQGNASSLAKANSKVQKDTQAAINRQKNAPAPFELPQTQPGDITQPRLNSRAVRSLINDRVQPAIKAANKLSPNDHALLDATRTTRPGVLAKQAENPAGFLDAATKAKQYNDFTHSLGTSQGQLLGYRQQYGAPLLYNLDHPQTADALAQYQSSLRTKPGYSKSRTTPDYATGQKLGLQRLNQNFAEDLAHDAKIRGSHISELTLAKGLREAFPGKVAVGEIPRGYTQLSVPSGQIISLPKDLASKVNNRATAPKVNNLPLRGYDALNRGLKYSQLGGGTFHALTTAETTAGQQLADAVTHPLSVPGKIADNLKLVATTLSRRAHDYSFRQLASDGAKHVDGLTSLDRAHLGGVTLQPKEILGDANVKFFDKAKHSRLNFIQNVHDLVFGRQIPEAKMMIFNQKTKGLDARNPADLAKMRQVGSAVNNLGGINRAVEGLTPSQMQKTARFVLATDFTETKFRKLQDALTRGGPQGNIARQMVIGKVIITALPGLAIAAQTGKLNTAEDWAKETASQIADPHIATPFTSAKGFPKVAKLPATEISELTRILTPLFNGSPDKLSGAKQYVTGRASAGVSGIWSLLTNQDYFGNPVIAKDAEGAVDIGKTAQNLALSKGPIPIQQGIKVATGQESLGEGIVNTIGPRVVVDQTDPEYQKQQAYFKARDDFRASLKNRNDQALFDKLNPQKNDANGNPIFEATRLTKASDYADLATNPAFRDKYQQYQLSQSNHEPIWDLQSDQLQAVLLNRAGKVFPAQTYTKGGVSLAEATGIANAPWYQDLQNKESEWAKTLPQGAGSTIAQAPFADPYTQQQMDQKNWSDPKVQNFLNATAAFNNDQRQQVGLAPIAPFGQDAGPGQVPYSTNKYASKGKSGGSRTARAPKAKKVKVPSFKLAKGKISAPKGIKVKKLALKSTKPKKLPVSKLPKLV